MSIVVKAGVGLKGRFKSYLIKNLASVLHLYPSDFQVIREYRVNGVQFRVNISNPHELWRWEQMEAGTKEPDTIRWIDRELKSGDVFFDVGACVGNYTVYAAARHSGLTVCAFEPEPNSFIDLAKNVHLNELSVSCFLMPLSDRAQVDYLNSNPLYSRDPDERHFGENCFIAGESNHQFGRTIKSHGEEYTPVLKIGMCSSSIDELVHNSVVPAPNHVKIDVDGIESSVLEGMRETIYGDDLKTIFCEISGESVVVNELKEMLGANGFTMSKDTQSRGHNYLFKR